MQLLRMLQRYEAKIRRREEEHDEEEESEGCGEESVEEEVVGEGFGEGGIVLLGVGDVSLKVLSVLVGRGRGLGDHVLVARLLSL